MSKNAINYRFAVSVPGARLRRSRLMFDPALNGSGGIDPKGLIRAYPERCRKLPAEWIALLEQREPLRGMLLVQTWRNLIQNGRCIGFDEELGLCQSVDERAEKSRRPYYGISLLKEGRIRGDTFSAATGLGDDVRQFGGGIPVLWDGRVLTIEEIAPEVVDFAHIWNLQVSSSRGTLQKDDDCFERLQSVFTAFRHASARDASDALFEEVRKMSLDGRPLVRERAYLHNVVGARADGGLVAIIANGSLEELGEMARRAGAVSAVVVDNGGSSRIALRPDPSSELHSLVESHYHRPPSIAVVIYELEGDPATTFLIGRSDVGADPAAPASIEAARSRPTSVALEFATDRGVVRRTVSVAALDSASADVVALTIGNFAMIHGATSAAVLAPPEFVAHVRSRFDERYRITPRAMDPAGLRGLWLEDYLKGIYDEPFEIGSLLSGSASIAPEAHERAREEPSRWSMGLDIGAENIKCVLLEDGVVPRSESTAPTRSGGRVYDSTVFAGQIVAAAGAVLRTAGIEPKHLETVGVSWPGAVRGRRAAHSKTMLDMEDMLPEGRLNVPLFERIRNLGPYLRAVLGLGASVPVGVYNDGEVEVAFDASTRKRRGVLLCKVGTTVAGAFIDRSGDYHYLMEIGRCVIRTDTSAPRHPYSRIQGMASRLIGSQALLQLCDDRSVEGVEGHSITKDPGREVVRVIDAGGAQAAAAKDLLKEMAQHIVHLLLECGHHMEEIDHIALCGGLMGDHLVGNLLRTWIIEGLPHRLAAKVDLDKPAQHAGAFAAAWLAARLRA